MVKWKILEIFEIKEVLKIQQEKLRALVKISQEALRCQSLNFKENTRTLEKYMLDDSRS